MIRRILLKKSIELFKYQDVHLLLITSDKIVGDVYKAAVKDIIPIAIKNDFIITFRPNSNPNRFDFEITQDLPF